MGHPIATLDRRQLEESLIAFLDASMPICSDVDYRLVGTAAALLHGVKLPTADMDILVRDRSAVDAFAAALSVFQCLQAPAWLPDTQQYYANYTVKKVEVGISTVEIESDIDIIETFGRGPWEHFKVLPCGRYQVPTVALELRLITEIYRDRPDRYEPLIEFMRAQGCDVDLVQRGIAAAGLPEDRQHDVLRMLGHAMQSSV